MNYNNILKLAKTYESLTKKAQESEKISFNRMHIAGAVSQSGIAQKLNEDINSKLNSLFSSEVYPKGNVALTSSHYHIKAVNAGNVWKIDPSNTHILFKDSSLLKDPVVGPKITPLIKAANSMLFKVINKNMPDPATIADKIVDIDLNWNADNSDGINVVIEF